MAFYDYLESMKPEELCTEEEMLERVEAILHEFVACHSRDRFDIIEKRIFPNRSSRVSSGAGVC